MVTVSCSESFEHFSRRLNGLLGQVAKFGDKPALVSLYAKTAAKAFEPAGETTGEVSYETSLSQVHVCLVSIRGLARVVFTRLPFSSLKREVSA